jgi:hypothetical protein
MDPYRAKLLSISNDITEKEFSDLKFLCKGHFPSGILEAANRPLELFELLERNSLLGPENNDYLVALLDGINRSELTELLLGEKGKSTVQIFRTWRFK